MADNDRYQLPIRLSATDTKESIFNVCLNCSYVILSKFCCNFSNDFQLKELSVTASRSYFPLSALCQYTFFFTCHTN